MLEWQVMAMRVGAVAPGPPHRVDAFRSCRPVGAALVLALFSVSAAHAQVAVGDSSPPSPTPQLDASVLLPPPIQVNYGPAASAAWDSGTATGFPWRRAGSLAIVGALNAGLWYWAVEAFWSRGGTTGGFRFHREGYFGVDTYAGGADKLGHMWANYALTRGVADILEWGGWRRDVAIGVSSGLCLLFFVATEFKDAYHPQFGWSWEDIQFNLAGQALALAMHHVPWLDERIAFRISYFPSRTFRESLGEHGWANSQEDYSGMTFLLAFHLATIPGLRERQWTSWMRFLDVNVGFRTYGYKPEPVFPEPRRQQLFVGIGVNVNEVLDGVLRTRQAHPTSALRLAHRAGSIYQPPFTTVAPDAGRVAPHRQAQ